MRKLIALTLAAAALMPAAASAAVSRGELQRDRQDVREEYREYRDAQRYGSPRDVREERDEYRSAVREYREDVQDWRHRYRDDYRNRGQRYGRDRWNGHGRYSAYRPGWQVRRDDYGDRYAVSHPGRYGLPPAYGANRWIRHHDDALLVNLRSGKVVRVIRNVW